LALRRARVLARWQRALVVDEDPDDPRRRQELVGETRVAALGLPRTSRRREDAVERRERALLDARERRELVVEPRRRFRDDLELRGILALVVAVGVPRRDDALVVRDAVAAFLRRDRFRRRRVAPLLAHVVGRVRHRRVALRGEVAAVHPRLVGLVALPEEQRAVVVALRR